MHAVLAALSPCVQSLPLPLSQQDSQATHSACNKLAAPARNRLKIETGPQPPGQGLRRTQGEILDSEIREEDLGPRTPDCSSIHCEEEAQPRDQGRRLRPLHSRLQLHTLWRGSPTENCCSDRLQGRSSVPHLRCTPDQATRELQEGLLLLLYECTAVLQ